MNEKRISNNTGENDLSNPVFKIPDTTIFGIPWDARLRKDTHQILYYKPTFMDMWCLRLTPAQVVLLSLFDGQRTLREVIRCVAFLDNCTYKAANFKSRHFLRWSEYSKESKLVDITSNKRTKTQQINCRSFLIPQHDVRLSTRLDKPVTLLIMLTDKCQTDCIYCYACRRSIARGKLLSAKRIHELIDEAAKMGVCQINLDGGDAFCRPESVEIIAHMISQKIDPIISTKCYISKDKAEQLKRAGLPYIQVSLDAPVAEMADYLVGRPGFFNRTIKSIHNLVEAEIMTRTNSIITSQSLHLLPQLVDFLMTLPLDNIKVAPAFGSLYRCSENIMLSPEQKKWFRAQMEEAVKRYPNKRINWECTDDVLDITPEDRTARFRNQPLCSSGRTQIVITPDGKVNSCEQSPQGSEFICGDVTHQSIEEVWNSKRTRQVQFMPRKRFKGTVCYNCKEFEACVHERGHCFLQALKAYGTPYAPHPDCPKAPLPSRRWQ